MSASLSSPARLREHLAAHGLTVDDHDTPPLDDLDLPVLIRALGTLTDFRGLRGRRHNLLPILVVAVWAVAAGASSYVAIADHARYADTGDLARLGMGEAGPKARRGGARRGVPSMATIRRVLLGIDAQALEAALSVWAIARAHKAGAALAATPAHQRCPDRELRSVISLDGKTVRGSRRRTTATVALVAALHIATGLVLTQTAIEGGDEIAAVATALASLDAGMDLTGVVMVADALHCQRAHAAFLLARGAHYIFRARDNQPTLTAMIEGQQWKGLTSLTTHDRDHARIETRTITVLSVDPEKWAGVFPGVKQVIKIHRRRRALDGPTTRALKPIPTEHETVYLATSLDYRQAPPALLAAWIRAEWHIENKIHYVRDVTYREDASRIRLGAGPHVMAALRNTGINLAHLDDQPNIAAAHREYSADRTGLLDRLLVA